MKNYLPSEYEVQLRPNDFDWSLQLNNSVYLQILEIGRWKWAEQNKLNFVDCDIAAVVSSINIEYLKPVDWNPVATIIIKTELTKIENYSIFMLQNIEDNASVITTAKVRLAMYDLVKKSVVPVKTVLK